MIDPIIANALARKEAADKAAATKAQKKARSASVPKHVKASGLGKVPCTLFVAEGDSAIGPFIKVRDDKTMGGFPLRGKVLNTWNMSDVDVLKNKEISQMVSIFGVGLGEDPFEYEEHGQFYEFEVNGEILVVNETDEVLIDDEWVKVSNLM